MERLKHNKSLLALITISVFALFAIAYMHARSVPAAFRCLFTRGYSERELIKIAQFSGHINELASRYPIEYTCKMFNYTYVFYVGSTGLTLLIVDEEGYCGARHYRTWSKPLEEFQTLQIGTDILSVYELDPGGHYPLLFGGDPLPFSAHYTSDGYYLCISYSDEGDAYRIKAISMENFFNFPMPEWSMIIDDVKPTF